ncbi:baseplate J/gp47 family protein [Burkholderia thailandensis]|uniref:Baseplate J-like family protein n=1 Tax=Burkholderia thailandensis TaxID=57975 RepID=A0AAW9CMR0_BURTH|nr:baseplate J/gp47 family protein [Burkholderia thailandensis]AHI67584.1 baseplate J-like family protein [Burkholderia thailandensis H0587]AIP65182.1 baseplate protein [Burkholderia thailandensis]AJY32095.1 baseplate J-like family protein [Burkholderia thailandensis 34]AOI54289.1 baseplate protein [Burkholderia thailandensis]AOJ53270.1 baseplate protein [Burkholderia thailandensis]
MTLSEPNFIDRDPQAITAAIIAEYEARTGKTLYPAQVERVLIDIVAYRETLVRVGVQEAAKQNLVAFARAPMIDYLGQLVGVTRLPAQPATTVVRFSVETPLATNLLIAAGTRVETGDGGVSFATDADAVLAAGRTSIDVAATCDTAGALGNGWQPGQINSLVDDLGEADVAVANTQTSANGYEEEETERLRERIQLAPEAFSTAGPRLAYVFHAKSAHQSIVDVSVIGPEMTTRDGRLVSVNGVPPGSVRVYPLVDTGLPGDDILARVAQALDDEKKRPLTDFVEVRAPKPVDYAIDARLTLYKDADAGTVLAQARAAANAYRANRAAGLGRDIVPAQLTAALQVPGVYDVDLNGLALRVLADDEWARCTGVAVVATGVAHG